MNMRWRSNSCRGHRENVSLLASGALPETEESIVREHLSHCAPCRQYYEELARLSGELQQWAGTGPAVEPSAAFRARWVQSIETADARISFAALISRCNEWLWPSPAAWGALAAIWVCLLSIEWSMPARGAAGQQMAASASRPSIVTFAQRQRELASVLESLAPAPPSRPVGPRPRSERRVEWLTT